MDNGIRHHHLGIEQCATRQLAVEEPAMPVRPVHHGGDRKPDTFVVVISHFLVTSAAANGSTCRSHRRFRGIFLPALARVAVAYGVKDSLLQRFLGRRDRIHFTEWRRTRRPTGSSTGRQLSGIEFSRATFWHRKILTLVGREFRA